MGFKRWFKIFLFVLVLNTIENMLLIGFLGVFSGRNLLMTLSFSVIVGIFAEVFSKGK